MSVKTGQVTIGSTGTGKSFTGFGFNPNYVRFTVGPYGSSSAKLQSSVGAADGTNQWVVASYNDPSVSHAANDSSSDCIWIRELIGGTWTDVLRANFNSFITDGFKLNVVNANSNYIVYVEAFSI